MGLDLQVDHVVQADATDWGVPGTPTIVLMNSVGMVEQFWIGKLSPAEEEQVIHAVT